MFYQERQIENLLLQLVDTYDSKKKQLLNQLIYGKSMIQFNIFKYSQEEIVLYLHENNPQILIIQTNDGDSKPLDIRRVKVHRDNYRFEDIFALKNKNYLILEEQSQQIVLIFDSQNQRQDFKRNFKQVARYIADFPTDIDSTIIKNFIKADKNKNLQLSYDQLFSLLQQIKLCEEEQIHDLKSYLKSQCTQIDRIGFRQFETIARILACRRQLIPIFQRYTNAKLTEHRSLFQKIMKYNDFLKFLTSQQEQSEEAAQNICKLFFLHKHSRISFYDFCQFLTGPLNNAVSSQYENFETPLDHPLHQYYCYSSHNTYLTGNQLTSDSKASRYHQDLQDGIRCVQIDCHNGANGPIVKHGYTVTSSITFQDVIQSIEGYHKQNPMHTPIILSLQNHCNNDNQFKMAAILQKYFGNNIISICQYQNQHKQLTLEQGIGKILIKGTGNESIYNQSLSKQNKQSQINIQQLQQSESDSEDDKQTVINNACEAQQVVQPIINEQQFETQKAIFLQKLTILQQRKLRFEAHRPQIVKFVKKYISGRQHNKSNHVINLKLLILTAMLSSGIIGRPSPWESVSLSEKTILNYHYNNTENKIKQHVKKGWVRAYPKATRFDSSNYNPLPSLQLGIQIIAINTQVVDYPSYLLARFFDLGKNKTHGYRLRPQIIDISNEYKKIKITPLSAMKIYYNSPHRRKQIPTCEIKMKYYGLSRDLKLNSQEKIWRSYTQIKKDNGFNPIFEKSSTMILRYHCKDLSFVVAEIEQCGIAVLPVGYLRRGTRTVQLYDDQLKPKDSKIIFLIQD